MVSEEYFLFKDKISAAACCLYYDLQDSCIHWSAALSKGVGTAVSTDF